jgi:hypothetical protein
MIGNFLWINEIQQDGMRMNNTYCTWMRANDISVSIFSRFNKKWLRNDWEMTENEPENIINDH